MSKYVFKIEAIEARVASHSCPRGTPGRVHTLRLQRRFHPQSRSLSTTVGGLRDWNIVHYDSSHRLVGVELNNELGQLLRKAAQPTPPQVLSVNENSLSLPRALEITASKAEDTITKLDLTDETYTTGHVQQLSPRMLKPYHGDTFGLPFAEQLYHPHPQSLDGSHLRKALATENPHDILKCLIGLVRVGDDGYQGNGVLTSLPANTFSEVLRILDPTRFVGRYVDLHKQIGPKNPVYLAFQPYKGHGLYNFCVSFIARIRSIIEARRSKGLALSLFDYKYLLRCARAVGNPRASYAVWLAMEQDRIKPDTECYNHYLAAKVWSDTLNSGQRHKVRVIPKNLGMRNSEAPSTEFHGHLVGPGIGIKHQSKMLFDQMAHNGLVGDEETFCMLIIALAREGDIDGVKAILSKLWGIDVDCLIKKGEDIPFPPRSFSTDSPLRPSRILLFSLAHAFGINNEIPVALRLVDYVSRKYSISISMEVWEELLERTFVLSTRHVVKDETEGLNTGQLPPEAVSNLWTALVSEPYNLKPTMAMYDKLIFNLLRRQKYGEVQERMEEALQLHIEAVNLYGKALALVKRQSSLPSLEAGSDAYQRLLDLQREETYQHFVIHRSRQYLRRWCQLFISKGTKSLKRNPTFAAINLPEFVEKYMTFMPRVLEYPIATGVVRFRSGYEQINKANISGYEARESWSYGAKPVQASEAVAITTAKTKENRDSVGDSALQAEEMFGQS